MGYLDNKELRIRFERESRMISGWKLYNEHCRFIKGTAQFRSTYADRIRGFFVTEGAI